MMSRGPRGASDQLSEYSKCKLAVATAELCEWYFTSFTGYCTMWRRERRASAARQDPDIRILS